MSKIRKWTEDEVRKYQEEHNATFYFNRDDANIFVKKYKNDLLPTFNFARVATWVIIFLIFVLCFFIMFFANSFLLIK